ncbi:hypothetical protein DPEC_G00181770 [Dallia pectoralis]|uniref:Uncharacterized protein n=1 Tax=Dallia pectoralis TaxID=75939 RepID=A0ACC2GAA4_DALPE|nr:hypothetical protein DPEC_G00181770 [Dallia pectoralis]
MGLRPAFLRSRALVVWLNTRASGFRRAILGGADTSLAIRDSGSTCPLGRESATATLCCQGPVSPSLPVGRREEPSPESEDIWRPQTQIASSVSVSGH